MDIALCLSKKVEITREFGFQNNIFGNDIDRPIQAWQWMNQARTVPSDFDWVRAEVSEAWQRCLEEYHLPLGNHADWDKKCAHRNQAMLQGHQRVDHIIKLLVQLSNQFDVFLQEAGVMLMLSDAEGNLLHVLGENPNREQPFSGFLKNNFQWNEQSLGNNGIGSCLCLRRPVAFQGMEHFARVLHPFTTLGFPLFDDAGELIAVLGLISNRQENMQSLYALLHLLSAVLKNHLLLEHRATIVDPICRNKSLKPKNKIEIAEDSICTADLDVLLKKAIKLQHHKIPILITGESGVGKDHFVQLLRNTGPRCTQPLIAINCSSIPRDLIESELFGYESGSFTGARSNGKPGKFLMADKGILFLDEIGDMSLDLQSTLLRVLETSEFTPIGGISSCKVDVQIVAATNVKLEVAVESGLFRRDLYYRLNGSQIQLPPLRERSDKLSIIHFVLEREISNFSDQEPIMVCPEVIAILEQHTWPGNIRQLINVIRSTICVATDRLITRKDLPSDFLLEFESLPKSAEQVDWDSLSITSINNRNPEQNKMTMADWEACGIRNALHECSGNISLAAKKLGITRSTLYKKIDLFNLDYMGTFKKMMT